MHETSDCLLYNNISIYQVRLYTHLLLTESLLFLTKTLLILFYDNFAFRRFVWS